MITSSRIKARWFVFGVAVVAALLVTSAFADNRGATFTGVGFIENPGPFPASTVFDMNPQGTELIVSPAFFGAYCVKWSRDGGWGEEIGASDGTCFLSENGTVMGTGLYPGSDPPYGWPGTWTGVTDVWSPIPSHDDFEPCGSSYISMYGMGGNGDFATGLTWTAGCAASTFRWDKATNTTINLGSPAGGNSRGNAISDDGRTVAGWSSMASGTWRGARWDDGTWSWIDGQGNIEPLACAESGDPCNWSGDCPDEYVDDSSCQNLGTCTAGVCVGGLNAGGSCEYYWDCPGVCEGGPSAGAACTDDWSCPDTEVCLPNPQWSNAAFKGEAAAISGSGHVVGQNFGYDWPQWTSAYRQNPDGSFTEIPTSPTFPDTWNPVDVSADGGTVVGFIGNPFFGSIPAFWTAGSGTQDLQLLLVQQGLDELFFWYLTRLSAVSADGTVMAGVGYNPDGLQEGFLVDLKKVWVCHAPGGDPDKARTLGIGFDSIGDHLSHGDFLGTCDFLNSGGLSRAAELRHRLSKGYVPARIARHEAASPSFNPLMNVGGTGSFGVSFGKGPRVPFRDKSPRLDEAGQRVQAPGRAR